MEIHLPSKLPTSLANAAYFGAGDDRTNVGQNQYYVSKDN
jgi:LruC domain-containing protein